MSTGGRAATSGGRPQGAGGHRGPPLRIRRVFRRDRPLCLSVAPVPVHAKDNHR